MADRDGHRILQRVVSSWDDLKADIERLHAAAEIRPNDGWALFRQVDATSRDQLELELSKVVFNLPERAKDYNTDLFVVVEGRVSFDRRRFLEHDKLMTSSFETRVAYFRRSSRTLDHVFGAHYEFSLREVGHPVFHGQLRSYRDFAENVKACYSIEREVDDCVTGLLKTVRVPTAQMDVFSLVLQLCADHLLHKDSGPEEQAAFNSLLQKSAFCQGTAYKVPRLGTEDACACYRARHWYPAIG